MKVTVSTTDYKFSHGHSPRGYGGWIFYRWLNQKQVVIAAPWKSSSYGAAKAVAIEMAKEMGISEIFVGS
jgi:SH3-like domain-containing protein